MSMATSTDTQSPALHVADSHDLIRVQGAAGVLGSLRAPFGIVSGPNGDLWFAEYGEARIREITTSGTITHHDFPAGPYPRDITLGPDGNVWFTGSTTRSAG